MRVLVVNAGSSSMKLRLLAADNTILSAEDIDADQGSIDRNSFRSAVMAVADEIDVVGHRIVHGGIRFTAPVLIDNVVEQALNDLTELAPLHQPKSLAGFESTKELLPRVPAFACFDTAFHSTLPEAAFNYAIPEEWRERLGIRRYGFHGLSHAYASRRAAQLLDRQVQGLRIVTCHLGAGASLAAVLDGISVDTTMGFTPLEGLVMATRSGSVDPGIITWLIDHERMTPEAVAWDLEHSSGLLGVAGTPDMEKVERRSVSGDEKSQLAVALYVHRLRAGIASMTSAMNGLDVLVFTGGVGENSALVRSDTAGGLGFLGVRIDEHLNKSMTPDADISAAEATVHTMVIEAREDVQIATEVRAAIAELGPDSLGRFSLRISR